MSISRSPVKKSPIMIGAIIILWAMLLIIYLPKFSPFLGLAGSIWEKLIFHYCIFWITLTWLYGLFHILGVGFSLRSKKISAPPLNTASRLESVAILYTTRNDFNAESAESCINQDYPDFEVYLLDDSTDKDEIDLIDRFHSLHSDRTVVVRRSEKRGFKAGNLNHALRTVATDCKYFVVVDSDETLPKDFVSHAISVFCLDSQIGFVQANHHYSPKMHSAFMKDMSQEVDLHWERYLSPRNRFGFVMFYGHGAVVRRDVWEKVGGFPEVVSEDIAFSTIIRTNGYLGLFLKDLVAYEEFPGSFTRFLTRELKVVKGTLEFMTKHLRSFIFSPAVTLTEKVDLFLSLSVLYLAVPFLLFIIVANVAIPICAALKSFPWWYVLSHDIGGFAKLCEPLGANLKRLWTWDFYLLTIISILSPLVYQLPRFLKHPVRILRYVFQSTTVYLAIVPSLVGAVISYILQRKVSFKATGDRITKSRSRCIASIVMGGIIGISLTLIGLFIKNVALLTVSASFLLFPILLKCSWGNKLIRISTFIPFVFFLAVFTTIPVLMLGVVGLLAAIVPSHH